MGYPMRSCEYCSSNYDCQPNVWILPCRCNEDMDSFAWHWDPKCLPLSSSTSENDKIVIFHERISRGTDIARGTELLTFGIHYWEVKLVSPVYGTAVMVGIGSRNLDVATPRLSFSYFLGEDDQSCGLCFRGVIHHQGKFFRDGVKKFARGDIVGCLLDMWHKKLTFFVNRVPAAQPISIKDDAYYPMVCSTAARTGVRLIYTGYFEPSLQNLTLLSQKTAFNVSGLPITIRNLVQNRWPLLLPGLESEEESSDPKRRRVV